MDQILTQNLGQLTNEFRLPSQTEKAIDIDSFPDIMINSLDFEEQSLISTAIISLKMLKSYQHLN